MIAGLGRLFSGQPQPDPQLSRMGVGLQVSGWSRRPSSLAGLVRASNSPEREISRDRRGHNSCYGSRAPIVM